MGLLFNGLVKVPMQFLILLLGVLVFVVYQFVPTPVFFDPSSVASVRSSAHAAEWRALEARHAALADARRGALTAWLAARHGAPERAAQAAAALTHAQADEKALRDSAVAVIRRSDPKANTNDTNYVFLHFVLSRLPAGLVGLVLAAIFLAAMNTAAAENHALTSTTVVDVLARIPGLVRGEGAELAWSRATSVFWVLFAVGFAQFAGRSGSLVETVNVLGSLFYGTILGIFLCAFFVKHAGGRAVLVAALVSEVVVLVCWKLDLVFWLWFNVVGCLLTVILAALLARALPAWAAVPERAAR
jgi:hypothetical protein